MVVNGIATQGRFFNSTCCTFDERVTEYRIAYSEDCSYYYAILDTDGQIKVYVFPLNLPAS